VCAQATTSEAPAGRKQGTTEVSRDATQKIDLNPPKGTRDFPPEEMRVRNWLFGHFRRVHAGRGPSFPPRPPP